MKLTIRSQGPSAVETYVALDGMEMTTLVELKLIIGPDDVNMAEITFVPEEIDVDAETLQKLHAVLDRQKPMSVRQAPW